MRKKNTSYSISIICKKLQIWYNNIYPEQRTIWILKTCIKYKNFIINLYTIHVLTIFTYSAQHHYFYLLCHIIFFLFRLIIYLDLIDQIDYVHDHFNILHNYFKRLMIFDYLSQTKKSNNINDDDY